MKSPLLQLNGKEVNLGGASPRVWIEEQIKKRLIKCKRCESIIEQPEEYSNIVQYFGEGPYIMNIVCDTCTERIMKFIKDGL